MKVIYPHAYSYSPTFASRKLRNLPLLRFLLFFYITPYFGKRTRSKVKLEHIGVSWILASHVMSKTLSQRARIGQPSRLTGYSVSLWMWTTTTCTSSQANVSNHQPSFVKEGKKFRWSFLFDVYIQPCTMRERERSDFTEGFPSSLFSLHSLYFNLLVTWYRWEKINLEHYYPDNGPFFLPPPFFAWHPCQVRLNLFPDMLFGLLGGFSEPGSPIA